MTQVVLWVMASMGVILAGSSVFQACTTEGKTKRSTWALLAAGQMLASPYATYNLLTESGMIWKVIFLTVLVPGIIAVCFLASDKNDKK